MDVKRLILVGNKIPYKNNLAGMVDSFDYVIRISRMNNFGKTGHKTDGLYIEANHQYKYVFEGGEYKNEIRNVNSIFMRKYWHDKFNEWPSYMTRQQYDTIELINEDKAVKDIGFERPTSAMLMLSHLINSSWIDNYKIYFTCMDVENRSKLINNNPLWAYHNGGGEFEEFYLKSLIDDGVITRIKDQ